MKKVTLSELEIIAENWYQRTHKLREIWQDENLPAGYRDKARRLWVKMVGRLAFITNELIKSRQPKQKFPSGGFPIYPKFRDNPNAPIVPDGEYLRNLEKENHELRDRLLFGKWKEE